MSGSIYDYQNATIKGEDKKLSDYTGKVMLVVNTASKCGLTPQYEGLEKLHQKYNSDGLEILGFPCNQFLAQEPGTESDISEFCQTNYGVSFQMFSKIDVNGKGTDPLYKFLKKSAPGLLNSEKIKWNFTKFLVSRDGKVLKRFAPATEPEKIEKDIKKALETA